MSYKIEIYGTTDKGRVRERNEDNFYYDAELGFMVVADGMGGHKRGDLASELAVKNVYEKYKEMILNKVVPEINNKDYSRETNILVSAFDYANLSVWRHSQENEETKGMGTTLTAAVFHNKNRFSVVHVGDSRAYLIREEKIIQLTQDDSFVMEQYRKGIITLEEAKKSSYRNILTKAIGVKQYINYFIYEGKLKDGDILILATDGFTKIVDDNEIIDVIRKNDFSMDLCRKLVDLANLKDGSDNITIVIAKFNVYGLIDKIFDKIT
jgi:serine/threonine protein phosphatase PrpC